VTREEAFQYIDRWRLVEETTSEELRQTPVEVKLRQLAVMVEAAHSLGWVDDLRAGEEEVRERWRLLKERMNV
jgi:hypothetical protein